MASNSAPARAVRSGLLALSVLLFGSVAGCGQADRPEEGEARAEGEVRAEGEAAGEGEIRIVAGERAADEHPNARLRIEAPRPGARVQEGDEAGLRLRLDGFELRAATPGVEERGLAITRDGQHLHVILDDRPYEAIYDISQPIPLDRLGGLEPGKHVVRAFPSRSWHESVKTPGAFAVTWFAVGEVTDASVPLDLEAPLLTYSRPKGAYEGADADSVMVDFYLTNVELSDGHRVRLTVNGQVSHDIDRWVPHYILGLPAGEHRVRLELLDPEGRPVPGPFNVAEHAISVARE